MDASAIPALEHTYKSITYTCLGGGLLKDGFVYEARPEKFFPPKPSKASKVGAAQDVRQVEKKPVAWWKAQCAFRGLNQSGAISDLQLRLRDAKKKMLPELKEAETRLNKEFKTKSKSTTDNTWKALGSVEQKATKDPRRFLVEVFPKGPTGRPANLDIVVLKIDKRAEVAAAAEDLGLETVSVDAPWTTAERPSPDRWIIVGRTRDAVWTQMREIEREAHRSKQGPHKEKAPSKPPKAAILPATSSTAASSPQKKPAAKQGRATVASKISAPQMNAEPSPRKIQTARRSAPFDMSRLASTSNTETPLRPKQMARRGGHSNISGMHSLPMESSHFPQAQHLAKAAVPPSHPIKREEQETRESQAEPKRGAWDVTGEWEINCPEIENGWTSHGPLTLKIFLAKVRDTHQMFAEFHFNVVEGVFRFMKPIPVPKSESNDSKKRKWKDEEDENDDVNMEEYEPYEANSDIEDLSNYTEKVFHLGAKDKPTARRPTWQYRWRGRETGEGEIQVDSDCDVQNITFSKKGEELSGTFICDFIGTCEFTGIKKGPTQLGTSPDPEYEWDNQYGDRAYEDASVSGWY